MICSFTNRFIYIAIPRTASTSMFNALRIVGAEKIRYGTSSCFSYHKDTDGFHDPCIIPELSSFFTFTTVRNPYTRMVSHYLFARSDEQHRLHRMAITCQFPNFVALAIRGRLLVPQVEFLGTTRIDAKLCQELDLEQQVNALPPLQGCPIHIQRSNDSTYDRPWYAYYDEITIRNVQSWAAADFASLNYTDDFGDAVAGKAPSPPPLPTFELSEPNPNPTISPVDQPCESQL